MIGLRKIFAGLLLVCLMLSCSSAAASGSDAPGATFVYAAYSSGNQYAVKSTSDNNILFFDNGKNAVPWSYNVGRSIGAVAISQDGKYIGVGCDGGLLYLFDRKGNIIWKKTLGNAAIKSIVFSKDGNYLDVSNSLYQAFYMSRDGERAIRPSSSSATPAPAATRTASPTGGTSPSGTDASQSREDGQGTGAGLIGIVAIIAVIAIVLLLVRQSQARHRIRELIDRIQVKDITVFSLVLMFIGVGLRIFRFEELSSIILGLAGLFLFLAYFLYAVLAWGAGHSLAAVIMIEVPWTILTCTTSLFPAGINPILYLFLILAVCGILAAILLFVSTQLLLGTYRFAFGMENREAKFFLPNSTYAILGIAFISLLAIGAGNAGIMAGNVNSVMHSTTAYIADSQDQGTAVISPGSAVTPVPSGQAGIPGLFPTMAPESHETGPVTRAFPYVVPGRSGTTSVNLYTGVYSAIMVKSPPTGCIRYNHDTRPCTSEEIRQYYLKYLNDPDQKKVLDPIVSAIGSAASGKDDQLRVAISMVQQIPYDYDKAYGIGASTTTSSVRMRSPYEVLYDKKGVCSEKSLLLAYIVRELGYGVILFEFSSERHMAVGIKSPAQYDFRNTGYAFVETTSPSIATDDQGNYVGTGKLTSMPDVLVIADGATFASVSEEFADAATYNQLLSLSEKSGGMLDQGRYATWMGLVRKYGLKTG
jgi:hypothetical protein